MRGATKDMISGHAGTQTTIPAGAIPEPMSDTPGVKCGGADEGVRGEGSEEERELRVLYQNVGRASGATHTVLQVAVEEKAEIVIAAEPWGEDKRRIQQPGMEVAYESRDIVVYRLKGSEVKVRGEGSWAMIDGDIAAAYLRPKLNRQTVRTRLRDMLRKGANTVIGDLNCHGNGKDNMLKEWIEEEELMDIGMAEYTHRYGDSHKCTIDRVLTKGGARPWKIQREWDHGSDHAILGLRKKSKSTVRQLVRIDWEAVSKYVEGEEGREEKTYSYVGEAYAEILRLKKGGWERKVTIVGRSKRWWKKEWGPLRKRAKRSRNARRELRREIRKAKREMWSNWVTEGKEVWDIVRVCKNPFGMRERCGVVVDKEGIRSESKEELLEAFIKHNLITEAGVVRDKVGPQRRRTPEADTMTRIHKALKKTRNNSAAGPDGISWQLVKALKGTRVGKALLEDIGQVSEIKKGTRMPEEWRGMKMVMIPKPGKDHTQVKGWRPIVLANVAGKLVEKLVAEEIQQHEDLWHERAFAGRKGRGAMDSVMLMAYIAEQNPAGVIIGRDAQSAFNTVRRHHMRRILDKYEDLGSWIDDWLAPRTFEMEVDGRNLGQACMTGGTPQGSPLSPALFTVYMSSIVWEVEKKLKQNPGGRNLRKEREVNYWPLSFIDDINGVRIGSERELDRAMEAAAKEAGVRWDREKNWKGNKGRHLGVVMQDQRRHQKYRHQKAKAAWEIVKRLNKLPARGKRAILTQQLLPILTYGSELYHEPSEQQRRLAYDMYRWTIGAYPGSRKDKVHALVGLEGIDQIMRNKRIRWAASVYGRHMPELRCIAEPILRDALGEEVTLRWMGKGTTRGGIEVEIKELNEDEVEEWTDGSRVEGRAAGATRERGQYLGEWATVADAEELGVLLAWERKDVVALDSYGVIQRILNLRHEAPRSWIEEGLVEKMLEKPRTLMWVKGHSGVVGNEEADRMAKRTVGMGWRLYERDIATPAGIRQEFPIYPKAPKHISWSRRALRESRTKDNSDNGCGRLERRKIVGAYVMGGQHRTRRTCCNAHG